MSAFFTHVASSLTEIYGRRFSQSELITPPPEDTQAFNGQVLFGTVHQVIHGTYLYRVVFDNFQPPLVCTSVSPYSVLQSVVSASYAVGSRVAVLLTHQSEWGVILGAIPAPYIQSNISSVNTSTLISGIGTFHPAWSRYLDLFFENQPLAAGMPNYAYHRVVDHQHGDYTVSNIFGGGFHTDPFMTYKGEIFIDADDGKGTVKTRARYVGTNAKENIALAILPESQPGVELKINLVQLSKESTLMTTPSLVVEGKISTQTDVSSAPFEEERLDWIKKSKENFDTDNVVNPNATYYDEQRLGSEEFVAACTFSYRNSNQCGADRFSFEEPYWMELYGQTVVTTFATWNEPVYTYQDVISQTAWPGHTKWVTDPCVKGTGNGVVTCKDMVLAFFFSDCTACS